MRSPLNISRLFLEIVVIVAVAEALVMLALPCIAPGAGGVGEAILDAGLLSILSGPVILWRCLAAQRSMDRSQVGASRFIRASALAVLGVGLGATIAVVAMAHRDAHRDARAEFEHLTERLTTESVRRINLTLYGMRGARGVFAATQAVRRRDFSAYVASRDLPVEFPGALGFGFIQRVERKDLDSFLDAERADGAPDFSVRTSGDASDLYVLKFLDPLEPNRAAWGFDLGSESVRRAAIERAVRTGEPALSEPISLVQGPSHSIGLLYLLPVYANGARTTTPEEREAALSGLVVAPLLLSTVLASVCGDAADLIDFEFFSGHDLAESHLVFDSDGVPLVADSGPERAPFGAQLFHSVKTLTIGGTEWSFAVCTTPAFEARIDRTTPVMLAVFGTILSVLLAALVWTLGQGRAHAVALAAEMTADLAQSKERAEAMSRELALQSRTLTEQSERMEFALAGSELGSWDWNPETNEATFDARWMKIIGETSVRPLGIEWSSRVHPDEWPATLAAVELHFAGETPRYESVHRLRHADGSWRWTRARGLVVARDANGKPTRVVGTQQDITKQKQVAEERDKLNREKALLLESTSEGILGLDLDGRCTLVNTAAARLLGYESLELLGATLDELIRPRCVANDRGQGPTTATFQSGQGCRDEEGLFQKKDGRDFTVRFTSCPIVDSGRMIGSVVSFSDITSRKLAQDAAQNLAAILDRTGRMAQIGGWELDVITKQTTWTDEVYRIHELPLGTPTDVTRGITFYAPEAQAEIAQAVTDCIAEGRAFDLELPLVTAQGRNIWVRAQGEAEQQNGVTVKVVGAFQDVTEQREARIAAQVASRTKSQFLANMSHEIRTPLTAILGYADLLREEASLAGPLDQRIQTIETIQHAGQHLLAIVNDILDLSKIEADKMTVEAIETPLVQILVETIGIVRPRAVAKGVVLAANLSTPIPEFVVSDPTRLRQILINLLGNAVKFTERGSVTMTAQIAKNGASPSLVIDVVDTGLGMTKRQAERVFIAFGQGDSTVTRKHGGTGLGLTVSRRLARLMNGDVTLEWTEAGRGSCFRVELPLVATAGAKMIARLDAVPTFDNLPTIAPAQRLEGRILLAEDGVDNQRLVCIHLRRAGAVVDIADNGRIALDLIAAAEAAGKPYGLLLTDMQMPEVDGYTLARTLRGRGSKLAIVALTAHTMTEDRKRCLDAGCDDYACKPVDKVALLSTCAAWLGAIGGSSQLIRPAMNAAFLAVRDPGPRPE